MSHQFSSSTGAVVCNASVADPEAVSAVSQASSPTLVVLAAGMGTRYGSLKQLAPMGPLGETILDYSVFDAVRAGFGRIVFVIRQEFANLFQAQVVTRYANRIKVVCVFQDLHDLPTGFTVPPGRTKPWGTVHAVLAARHVLDGFFTVINADDFYGRDAYHHMMAHYRHWIASGSRPDQCAMVPYPLEITLSSHGGVNRGLCKVQDELLTEIAEVTDIQMALDGACRGRNLVRKSIEVSAQAMVSMNFWGFTPVTLTQMAAHFTEFMALQGTSLSAECYIPTAVDKLIHTRQTHCCVLSSGSVWFGMTYPQDKAACASRLGQLIEAEIYPPDLWHGYPATQGANSRSQV